MESCDFHRLQHANTRIVSSFSLRLKFTFFSNILKEEYLVYNPNLFGNASIMKESLFAQRTQWWTLEKWECIC